MAVPSLEVNMKAQFAVGLSVMVLAINWVAFSQGNDGYTRRSLYGLAGIQVVVELMLPREMAASVTDVELEVETERALQKAGIKVFDRDKTIQVPGRPKLRILVHAVKSSNLPVHALFLEAALAQRASLERDNSISTEANTWSLSAAGVVENPDLKPAIRNEVARATDQFITAFREQNPKK